MKYFSEKLEKAGLTCVFDTVDEFEKAEAAFDENQRKKEEEKKLAEVKKQELSDERKRRAEELEVAKQACADAQAKYYEENKKAKEEFTEAYQKLNEQFQELKKTYSEKLQENKKYLEPVNTYVDLFNKFNEDYNGWHITYRQIGDDEFFDITSKLIKDVTDQFNKVSSLFDTRWF